MENFNYTKKYLKTIIMKKILLVLILSGFVYGSYGQHKVEPDKQTTTIYLKVKGDAASNYKTFGRMIIENGFIIDKSDPEFLSISTQHKSLAKRPGYSHSWYFNAQFSDSLITIKPFWSGNIEIAMYGVKSVNKPYEWNYAKGQSNIQNMIYNEIIELVSKYPKVKITYN